jgi:hypothetical protein
LYSRVIVMKLFVEAYLKIILRGTVDVLIERSLKNGVLALVLHTAVQTPDISRRLADVNLTA